MGTRKGIFTTGLLKRDLGNETGNFSIIYIFVKDLAGMAPNYVLLVLAPYFGVVLDSPAVSGGSSTSRVLIIRELNPESAYTFGAKSQLINRHGLDWNTNYDGI